MARVLTCGWETGYVNGAPTVAGGNEFHCLGVGATGPATIAVVANPAWWSSGGSYVYRHGASETGQTNFLAGALGEWVGFKWGCNALPPSENDICNNATTGNYAISVDNLGVLRCYTAGNGNIFTSASGFIVVQKMYMVELRGAVGVQEFWLDGVKLASAASSNTGDSWVANPNISLAGHTGLNYFDDFYSNDAAASPSGNVGRRGRASVRSLVPIADVGSVVAGSFTNSAGLTYLNASTGWFSAFDDTLPYAGGLTDYVGKSVADTNRGTCSFAASVANLAQPNAVSFHAWFGSTTALACTFRLMPNANGIDGAEAGYIMTTTTVQCASYHTDVASPGVPWRKDLLDAIQMKYGSSNDVSPVPRMHALYATYETSDVRKSIITLDRRVGRNPLVRR